MLIAPTTVLSARHCSPSTGGTVRFGTNRNSPTFSTSIQSVLFPGGGSAGSPLLNGGDVAILTLNSVVPSHIATPFVLTDATTELTGFSVVTLGYAVVAWAAPASPAPTASCVAAPTCLTATAQR